MNIEKSLWSSNGDNIVLSVPFTKVNREKRTVSGFATLDNIDQTNDMVTAEASLKHSKISVETFVRCMGQMQLARCFLSDQKHTMIQKQKNFTTASM